MSTSAEDERPVEKPRHAGLGVRFVASLLDVIAMGAPAYVVVSFFDFDWLLGDGPFSLPNIVNTALLTLVTILLWVNWDGRTPGKKLTRIRIVSYPEYRPFSYGTAAARSLISVASALPLLAGYIAIAIMIALREDKRGYHDLLARTVVIHDG